jgi:hypothetical protein
MRRASIPQEQVKLSRSGKLLRRMVVWAHEVHLAQGFPYSLNELRSLEIGELRFIARMCLSWVNREVLGMSRTHLIQWIQGDQPQAPVPPWPAPVRAEIVPLLEEIRQPRR